MVNVFIEQQTNVFVICIRIIKIIKGGDINGTFSKKDCKYIY